MAMTFPLNLAAFSDTLRVVSMRLSLPEVVEESQTGAGEIIRAQLGAQLWQGSLELWPMRGVCARQYRAKLDLLQRPGASFLISPHDFRGPISEPDRASMTGVTLDGVAANNRDITVAGLPQGLVLQAGDYLSFTYATGPVRYAFHQIVSSPVTVGAGQVATVEVNPPVRPGWAAGVAVQMVKPRFKAMLRSRDPGETRMLGLGKQPIHSGLSFDFIQTLR